jgi:proline iminopeptidase
MDQGTLPLIVIPGMQGHAEWQQPAVDALRETHVVKTFSLDEEDGVGDPFAQWSARIDALLAATGQPRAVLVGVSFGGLVAVQYAAAHPDKVAAIVLVSSPSPRMKLGSAEQNLLKRPLLLMPVFAARGFFRLLPEVIAAHDTWPQRLSFLVRYGLRVLAQPMNPRRSATWIRAWLSRDLTSGTTTITAPTLVMTGDEALDRVVPVSSTRDYLALIPGARAVVLPRSGHIGLVTRPRLFAQLVDEFLHDLGDTRSRRTA